MVFTTGAMGAPGIERVETRDMLLNTPHAGHRTVSNTENYPSLNVVKRQGREILSQSEKMPSQRHQSQELDVSNSETS